MVALAGFIALPAMIEQASRFVPVERIYPCTNCGMAPMDRSLAISKLVALTRRVGLRVARTRGQPTQRHPAGRRSGSAALRLSAAEPRPGALQYRFPPSRGRSCSTRRAAGILRLRPRHCDCFPCSERVRCAVNTLTLTQFGDEFLGLGRSDHLKAQHLMWISDTLKNWRPPITVFWGRAGQRIRFW
jgi:hypothetical protein